MWLITIACLALSTGLSLALEGALDSSSLVMVFLGGVAVVAYWCNRVHALTAIAGSILVYDLIFVPPRWSLKPAEPRYWLAFAVMAAVGWVISDLAARLREQVVLAESRAAQRAQLERQSQAAAIEAERERLRSTLLAGISHDFRTPLTTIIGCATALLEQSESIPQADRRRMVQDLLAEAQRLHRLSSNLLELSRLDEGAVSLRPEWCPAEDLVEEALRTFGAAVVQDRLEVVVPSEAVVWADPVLVHQVLVNLVDNALRHAPGLRPIRLRIAVDASQWILSVADEGPGVTPGDEVAVFQKFYRAASDRDSNGKGLGLAICAAVLKLHGGQIGVVNTPGACFTAVFPQPTLPAVGPGGLA